MKEKKKSARDPHDFYSTPKWCVDRLLEAVEIPTAGLILEPSAGSGAILTAMQEYGKNHPAFSAPQKSNIYAVELQEEMKDKLAPLSDNVHIGDFLSYNFADVCKTQPKADYCIGNPPYKLAFEMVKHALKQADTVCFLMRINFLSSDVRAEWMRNNVPDVYVLPNRPKFKNNRSDSCEYAWCVWGEGATGKLTILNTTSKEERRTY